MRSLTKLLAPLAAVSLIPMPAQCAPPDDGPPSMGPGIICDISRCTNGETITFGVWGASGWVWVEFRCFTEHGYPEWWTTVEAEAWFNGGGTSYNAGWYFGAACPSWAPYLDSRTILHGSYG